MLLRRCVKEEKARVKVELLQLGAEKKVSFDNGPDGSIAEDCYFAMIAYRDGYSFDFVDGEMNEKSPFTLWDFLRQRKRWIQGIYLTVHSSEIPWRIKVSIESLASTSFNHCRSFLPALSTRGRRCRLL